MIKESSQTRWYGYMAAMQLGYTYRGTNTNTLRIESLKRRRREAAQRFDSYLSAGDIPRAWYSHGELYLLDSKIRDLR